MSEEKTVTNESVEENVAQVEAQESPTPDPSIAESKKYRKRAQLAESELAELRKNVEAQENAELKKNEEYKTYSEKLEAENTSLSGYKEKYESIVAQRKEVLLSQFPEDEREKFKDKELDVLEFMVKEISSKAPSEPNAHNQVRGNKTVDNWTSMPKDEIKANWKNILRIYKKD